MNLLMQSVIRSWLISGLVVAIIGGLWIYADANRKSGPGRHVYQMPIRPALVPMDLDLDDARALPHPRQMLSAVRESDE